MQQPNSYRSVARRSDIEIIIKKSRFIGLAQPVATEEEALQVLDSVKQTYPDATHHCYAYITNFPERVVRMNDDGEPAGTAGRPILEVIEREDLTNTIVIATRYFGGTMLGAAGLVRAYARTASESIAEASIVQYVLHARWLLRCEYSHYGKLEHFLGTENIPYETPQFGADVAVELAMPEHRSDALRGMIDDLLGGSAEWEKLPPRYLPDSIGNT